MLLAILDKKLWFLSQKINLLLKRDQISLLEWLFSSIQNSDELLSRCLLTQVTLRCVLRGFVRFYFLCWSKISTINDWTSSWKVVNSEPNRSQYKISKNYKRTIILLQLYCLNCYTDWDGGDLLTPLEVLLVWFWSTIDWIHLENEPLPFFFANYPFF